jgi:uncharacterized cupin superfamily protein
MYIISGRMKVVMDDGTEDEYGPGDTTVVPPGHVAIDFTGAKEYARDNR